MGVGNGDEIFKYKTIATEAEQEERRMSDLSDWAALSVASSSADFQVIENWEPNKLRWDIIYLPYGSRLPFIIHLHKYLIDLLIIHVIMYDIVPVFSYGTRYTQSEEGMRRKRCYHKRIIHLPPLI